MSEYKEVSEALKTLENALNKTGADIEIKVEKISARSMKDERERYIYQLSAFVKEQISNG